MNKKNKLLHRPTAKEIKDCFDKHHYNPTEENKKIIKLAEDKRQETRDHHQIKVLSDTKNYKHHPGSFYTSRLLNKSIEQAHSSMTTTENTLNFSTAMITKDND